MKTKEELNALKNEVEALNKKLAELTDEERAQVTGGGGGPTVLKAPGIFIATIVGGLSYTCGLCGSKPANRAMANHLVNMHHYTREAAMAAVPEDLRAMQWD